MSATNRGSKREAGDFYPTPAWVVHRLLEAVDLPGGLWLEPTAGTGSIIQAVSEKRRDVHWNAIEIQKKAERHLRAISVSGPKPSEYVIGDFLKIAHMWRTCPNGAPFYDVCITNPPYSLAQKVIDAAFPMAAWVIMLLRVGYLESETRADWLRKFPPDGYILPNRPTFVRGQSDNAAYAWCVWPPDRTRSHGRLSILKSTPRIIRCPHEPAQRQRRA